MISIRNTWGVPTPLHRQLATLHGKTFDPPHKLDSPDKCVFGELYWHQHPIKNYNYRYNNAGFRDRDYEQYDGQTVNVCIGDSNTVNIGGPIEHSWSYLLGQYFNTPTLNLGIDGACFYQYIDVLEKARKFFKVDKIFVLYNLFDNDQEKHQCLPLTALNSTKIDTKVNVLKNHCWIHGAYWQFDPPWSFFKDELPCLYEHFPTAHNYLKNIKLSYQDVDLSLVLAQESPRLKYYEIAGSSWMPYEKFCELCLANINVVSLFNLGIDQHLVQEFLSGYFNPMVKQMLLSNRDGWHLSKMANMHLANYFYQQTLTGNQG
jgi:hypothetical protein